MPDTMVIGARYGLTRTIKLMDKERGIFRISGQSRYMRRADTMADFEGGPMICVGEDFWGYGIIKDLGFLYPEDTEDLQGVAKIYVSVDISKNGLKLLRKKAK